MSNVDLSGLEGEILQGASVIILGLAGWATQRLIAWLNLKVSAQQTAQLDGALQKALTYGITQAQGEIATKGWDHVDVKNQVVAIGLQRMVTSFPDVIKATGLDPSNPADATHIQSMLERAFPEAASVAAASPATPATNPPVEKV